MHVHKRKYERLLFENFYETRRVKSCEICRVASVLKLIVFDPDVAVLDLVAVTLKEDAAGFAGFGLFGLAAGGLVGEFRLVVDEDPVVLDRNDGVRDLFALVVELSGRDVEIVGLPRQRREARVDDRLELLIEARALVVLAFEPEGV